MRVSRIFAGCVNCGEVGCSTFSYLVSEISEQRYALRGRQFEGEGENDFVAYARILATGRLLGIHPCLRLIAVFRDKVGHDVGLCLDARDVAHMRSGRAAGVRRLADRTVVEAVDRHAGLNASGLHRPDGRLARLDREQDAAP